MVKIEGVTGDRDWVAVAPAGDVGGRPLAVAVDGVPLVLLRAGSGALVAWPDRCPHRLVPLSAGSAGDGTVRCAYHGWEFTADGRCVDVPSQPPGTAVPPRAHLTPGPRVREEAGTVWVHRGDVAAAATPDLDLLSNVDGALLRAWHPVALSTEVTAEPYPVRLCGREWTVRRTPDGLRAEPECYGLRERWGVVWLAPARPLVELFDDPDAEDEAYVGAWLPPSRTPAPAGFVADNFLDVAHFPFVHAGTFGAQFEREVPAYEVTEEPYGCRSVQEWFDDPEDPGVPAGHRLVRQRRRGTYVYRAPFQLMLRVEQLDAGTVRTILFFLQPETAASTRIYTKILLYDVGGAQPDATVMAREVAFEEAVLVEDLALQQHICLSGLPLRPRDELHVRADRLGIALRRILRGFVAAAR